MAWGLYSGTELWKVKDRLYNSFVSLEHLVFFRFLLQSLHRQVICK